MFLKKKKKKKKKKKGGGGGGGGEQLCSTGTLTTLFSCGNTKKPVCNRGHIAIAQRAYLIEQPSHPRRPLPPVTDLRVVISERSARCKEWSSPRRSSLCVVSVTDHPQPTRGIMKDGTRVSGRVGERGRVGRLPSEGCVRASSRRYNANSRSMRSKTCVFPQKRCSRSRSTSRRVSRRNVRSAMNTRFTRVPGVVAVGVPLSVSAIGGQTVISPPKNKYTPAQDVELGQQAAKEVEQQLPLLRDDGIESFVDRIVRRLVQVMPSEMEHREFRYSFKVINVREINAFALPGGPMYINRGMIQAAGVEGEVAGVMAHELSHVMCDMGPPGRPNSSPSRSRHCRRDCGRHHWRQRRAWSGRAPSLVWAPTSFVTVARTRSRPLAGRSADGARRIRPARSDAHVSDDRKQGGGGGPQFMSDHPNPGNREAYITQEASHLRIEGRAGDSREFARVQEGRGACRRRRRPNRWHVGASRRPPGRDNRRPTRANWNSSGAPVIAV